MAAPCFSSARPPTTTSWTVTRHQPEMTTMESPPRASRPQTPDGGSHARLLAGRHPGGPQRLAAA
eukprot:1001889-Lingulodinium_polyedra.AAC.1